MRPYSRRRHERPSVRDIDRGDFHYEICEDRVNMYRTVYSKSRYTTRDAYPNDDDMDEENDFCGWETWESWFEPVRSWSIGDPRMPRFLLPEIAECQPEIEMRRAERLELERWNEQYRRNP